jgi:HSP20 family protein|tara:strand:- start:3017 stop:3385 length:369 start_codon:yes stop_codon:yes gene_type:complete
MFYTIDDNLVNDFFNDLDTIFTSSRYPKPKNYKTSSDEDGVTLTMNVPGYNKKTIEVTIDNGNLVISGKPNTGDTDGFEKRFTLNDNFDTDNIEATVADGVLTVLVSYLEEVKPKKIEVKVK